MGTIADFAMTKRCSPQHRAALITVAAYKIDSGYSMLSIVLKLFYTLYVG